MMCWTCKYYTWCICVCCQCIRAFCLPVWCLQLYVCCIFFCNDIYEDKFHNFQNGRIRGREIKLPICVCVCVCALVQTCSLLANTGYLYFFTGYLYFPNFFTTSLLICPINLREEKEIDQRWSQTFSTFFSKTHFYCCTCFSEMETLMIQAKDAWQNTLPMWCLMAQERCQILIRLGRPQCCAGQKKIIVCLLGIELRLLSQQASALTMSPHTSLSSSSSSSQPTHAKPSSSSFFSTNSR